MNSFGQELAHIRKRAGLSQYQLAKELNFSRSHIFRIENGERNPNKELVEKFFNILKTSNYDTTKLLILADIEPKIEDNSDGFKLCFYLALEFKNKGMLEKAKYLIKLAMSVFKNKIELNALLANLNLLNHDYELAIKTNEQTIKDLYDLPKSQLKKIGITKAEIIHNLGYVYFERGLEKNEYKDKLVIENWQNKNKETEIFINELKNEIIEDFDISIQKMEEAVSLELDNLHIVDQLARIYYHKADLTDNVDTRSELFNKSIFLYESIISSNSSKISISKKQEASIFLAVALGKIFHLKESARLINTLINCKPLYYFGYFAKSCIYAINGKNNQEFLEISYNSLVQALKLNTELKEYIKLEVDLYNLRFNDFFKEKFDELYLIQEENNE